MENNVPLLAAEQNAHSTMIGQPWLRILRVAWVVLAILAVAILIASLPGYILYLQGELPFQAELIPNPSVSVIGLNLAIVLASISAALLSLILAWVIFRRRSDEAMAVFLSFFLLIYGAGFAGPLELLDPLLPGFATIGHLIVSAVLFGPASVALMVLFPDGRFVPHWTRWLILLAFSSMPMAYFFETISYTAINEPLLWLLAIIGLSAFLLALYAQIYRYRLVSNPIQRQQTKWVVYGLTLWFVFMIVVSVPYAQANLLPPGSPIPWWFPINELVFSIALTFLPVSLTIAVLRYRLYDIDILINRTLVYGALTVSTMGIYVFIVGYLGNLFQTINQTFLAFLATGLVAILFQPLRERLQAGVNRLMFGDRDDPVAVLGSLSRRLEAAADPEAILPGIVDTVGQTLKLPFVAIEVYNGQTTKVVADFGDVPESSERLPLIHQSKTIGQLVFARRSPHESFSEAEYKLLRNIARQTGAAVHAAKLTADLRRSRQQLVTAREEERRRLRRDLHDGLGPTLAGVTLRIDIARNKLVSNPDGADTILVETKGQIQDTIGDIRRLVYQLRPPALDEMGLEKAVRAFIDQQKTDGLKITIEDSDGLSTLPAAVGVAAYRIALEGITNVIRHAQASNAVIRIYPEHDNLILEIKDDGIGLPEPIPLGVGMTSMRERAEELGGQLQLIPQSPGTLLRACLPCSEE
jgi:signal transduction histidine kinase